MSLEGLAWAGARLFSCGLHGQLVEYDLTSRQERGRLELYGVREEEGGQYICSSLSQGHSPGGSQAATIQVLTAVP